MSRVTLIALLLPIILLPAAMQAAPVVTNVAAPSGAGLYERYEVTFSVGTVASNYYWPYDENPNVGVPAGVGVTVDGLFLPPGESDWGSAVVQPGFYHQEFERRDYLLASKNEEWIYAVGEPCWKVRFAPTMLGEWRFRIRVTDSSGSTTYEPSPNAFLCTSSQCDGFVRVSLTDPRYFETSSGKYINFVGLADNCWDTYEMENVYATLGENGVNLIRPWWQGSQGPILFGLSGQGGVREWENVSLSGLAARPGQLFSSRMTSNGFQATRAYVKPGTHYRFSAWVKTADLEVSGGGGVHLAVYDCTEADVVLTPKLSGNTDWTELVAHFKTKSKAEKSWWYDQYKVDWLRVVMSGRISGSAYIADASLREDLGNGQYGPEQLGTPSLNRHQYVSQKEAWKADYQVEQCKLRGIYLKVCLQEKADIVFGRIQSDGTVGSFSTANVYASSTHASRTYQRYFWRYIIARYSYATNLHSFELVNEGGPFNEDGNHYGAASAMADYFRANDPNRHLVLTSFWHSFPTEQFWSHPDYAHIGYGDWHQYIGKTTLEDLQTHYGFQKSATGFGTLGTDAGWYRFTLSDAVYRSAPSSLYLTNTTDPADDPNVFLNYHVVSYPIPVSPSHTYVIKWYMKGQDVVGGPPPWDPHPCVSFRFKTGWWLGETGTYYWPWEPARLLGTFDWTERSARVTAPNNARYISIMPTLLKVKGHVWFDDITIYDETTGKYIEVPNGNFDAGHGGRLDFDSALMTYSVGTQVGVGSSRAVAKPVIRGEVGIRGDNVYGSPYKGFSYTTESQELVDDNEGVWYRKLVWGQINHFGVIDMYWWRENILAKGLCRYAKAYQAFMAGIPLSNGHYRDAAASCSDPKLRAWGQKDLTNNRAHLWIDNAPYTWKNVVDGVAVPAVSGTVSVSGLRDGHYRVEWWSTSTGEIGRTEDVECSGGVITLSVQNLESDIACKLYPTPAKIDLRVLVPSSQVVPGQEVTITVEYTNTGETEGRDVVIKARLPAEMDYIAGSAEESGGVWDEVTKTATWVIHTVPAQQTGTRTFRARVR